MKILGIGDVHGCIDHLEIMLKAVDDIRPDKVVFTGDFIDRGKDSKAVLKRLKTIAGGDVDFLVGNHEEMSFEGMLFNDKWSKSLWLSNGGSKVFKDYGYDQSNPDEDRSELIEDLRWLYRNSYLHREYGNHFFVHAGINPYMPLKDHTTHEFLWIRNEFLLYPLNHFKYVVHGHTVTEKLDIEIHHNRCNIDGGCVFGGKLIGALFDTDREEPYPIKVISVDNDDVWNGTYEERDNATLSN